MIVRCKSNITEFGKLTGLTTGKLYFVEDVDIHGFKIVDDMSRKYWYMKSRFYPIDEERNRKIEQLWD